MTATEIKNAWNKFKKEVQKEVDFDMTGDCYMNKKQIENGTATIYLCNDIEYDADINYIRRSIDKVNSYDSWTDEEKRNSELHNLALIEKIEAKKAAYGTPANEAQNHADQILGSAAYKKLAETIGIQHAGIEYFKKWAGLNAYQIRISY